MVLGCGTALGWALQRLKLRTILTNGGMMTISALAGVGVEPAHRIGSSGLAVGPSGQRSWQAPFVLAVVNEACAPWGAGYLVDQRFWPAFVEFLRFRARMAPFLVMIGLLLRASLAARRGRRARSAASLWTAVRPRRAHTSNSGPSANPGTLRVVRPGARTRGCGRGRKGTVDCSRTTASLHSRARR